MKVSKMRVLSLILALVMIVGSVPFNAFAAVDYDETVDDYYNVISKTDYELAPGISESEIVLNNDAGSHRQVAHVVEVDIDNPYTKVIPSYKGMAAGLEAKNYGVQIMSQQAAYAEANGYGNVVAAMNLSLSWYDSAYYKAHPELVGEPLGYMILDGVQYTNSQGKTSGAQTCLVINFDEKDGVARPADIPKTEIRSTSSAITGWEEQVIPANFGFLVKDGVNQYSKNHTSDPASRSFVGIKADGDIVIVMNDGRQSPYSAGFNNYEMAQFMISLGCVQAVNGDGGGSSAFLSQRPGEELKINCSPSDGAERETTHGVLVISTAPATGEFVRASISSAEDYYTPGSSVQFNAIGSDLVGTAAEIPENAVWQLADASMGTIDENGLFVSNGTEGAVTVQIAVDGTVVGEDTIHIVMPDALSFVQTNMIVPYGKTVDLGFSATYDNKNVVLKASDVTFVLSDATLGTVNGFEFTAAEEGTAVTSSTLNATVGELTITANLSLGKGSEIVFDFEDQDLTGWIVDDWYGQYGPKGPNGKVTDDNGNYWYNGQNELGSVNIVNAETGEVRNGDYALAMHCDYTQIYETGYHGLVFRFPAAVDCTDAVAVGMWLYVPEEAKHAEFRLGVGGNAITLYDNGQLMDLSEGWNYIKLDISAVANKTFSYIGVQVDDRACAANAPYYDYITEANLNGKYTFYVDDITVDYSSAVDDREAPVFSTPTVLSVTGETSAELSGQTVDYNTLTFEAKVAENTANSNATGLDASTAKAYIDGVEVAAAYSNGKFTITNAVLADGLHTVTFSICDKMGNYAHISGEIVVAAKSGMSTVKVVPQDPDADRLKIGSLYWLDVVATDIETVQEVELVLDLNNASSWELEGMELAEGFTSSYSVQADDNIATITITRTGENTQTGEAVIASLPARTWVSTITECEGYEDQTPEKLWARGIIWHKSLIVEQDMGLITFVDDTTASFDSADLEVDTEIWFTYYSRKLVEGAVGYYAANTGWHTHTAEAMEDKDATCTESGYTGRTYCAECDSVVEWGTVIPATGHNYVETDGVLSCVCGKLFNGEKDGKTYIDGVVANGWIDNTYYYIDGVMVTGQYYMDGKMYTFGTDGVYDPTFVYTGFYETADGKLMHFVGNHFVTGYQFLMGDPYVFDANGIGYEGEYTMAGETCLFDNGQFVSCSTADVLDAGVAGPNATYVLYTNGTFKLDGTGATYSFTNHGTRPFADYTYKIKTLQIGEGITRIGSYFMCYSSVANIEFAENSNLQQIGTAAFLGDWGLREVTLPASVTYVSDMAFSRCTNMTKLTTTDQLTTIHNNAFKNSPSVTLYVLDGSYAMEYAIARNIPYVVYTEESVREIVEVDGVLYYYVDGVKTYGGLIYLDGYYYYVRSSGQLVVNRRYWITMTNDLLPAGDYTFGADGKMVIEGGDSGEGDDSGNTETGSIVDVNGTLYFYKDGKPFYAGLIKLDGNYYYVRSSGQLVVGRSYWITLTNDLLPAGDYTFGADGKMVIEGGDSGEGDDSGEIETGSIVDVNGVLYYYKDGKPFYAGLIQIDGDYYYVRSSGQLVVGRTYWITLTNDLLPAGNYTFGTDGKMIIK